MPKNALPTIPPIIKVAPKAEAAAGSYPSAAVRIPIIVPYVFIKAKISPNMKISITAFLFLNTLTMSCLRLEFWIDYVELGGDGGFSLMRIRTSKKTADTIID